MREITIDGKEIRVKATPLALLFYKQEFKKDLIGDLAGMEKVETDISNLDTMVLLQMTWAMSKAANLGTGNTFPSFEKWLSSFENIDFADKGLWEKVIGEAVDGFFRGARGKFPGATGTTK